MAISNIDQVGRGLDLLADGLAPYIARWLDPLVPAGRDWTWLLEAKDGSNGATGRVYSTTDPQNELRVLTERIGNLGFPFKDLSRAEQNLAGELREVRDNWAHRTPFSPDDAYRALDTMERLLRAVGAVAQADRVRVLRQDVQRGAYEQETRRTARALTGTDTADAELPSWREVLHPHRDVRDGTYAASEFAADLYRVAIQSEGTADEYADPVEFFRRTYLTAGLRDLLTRAVARVGGDANANPVINLQDRFGGGKTHSMLAVWHLLSGRPLADYPQEVQDLLRGADLTRPVRRVALVGNELSPGQANDAQGRPSVRTMWGELAWQLGGADAYALVAESDRSGTNPGALLRELFVRYSPVVVLVDEWVAYARQLFGRDDLVAGTFETQFTFAQSLTQAAAAVPGALLLVSVPASDARLKTDGPDHHDTDVSDLEVGGAYGREALERLDSIVRRVAHAWDPATPEESFEIVRRRLFDEPDNAATATVNAVARKFTRYYAEHPAELPSGVADASYEQRIRTAYPIHPELLDRLYSDWSTLEKFQRTRGVLKLMSNVVHHLWQRQDPSPLILPGSVPLDAAGARSDLVQYIGPKWASIIETDVDGDASVPVRVSQERPLLGSRSLALRTARTLFLASAPRFEAAHKGVDRKRVALGVVMPGDVLGNVGSALDGLANGSSYLFHDGDQYWYDTQPSLNRRAADLARDLPEERVVDEVVTRLRKLVSGPSAEFVGVIAVPDGTTEVPDDDAGTRLVVLRPEQRHNGKDRDSAAAQWVADLVQHRGTAPRVHANSVVGLAADDSRWRDLAANVRSHLAWRSILADKARLDLTLQNVEQAEHKVEQTSRSVDDQLPATWIWALHAQQDDPRGEVVVSQLRCDGGEEKLLTRVGKKLVDADVLRVQTAPALVHVDLVGALRARWNTGHVSVTELWDFYSRYPYLVRLRDRRVLTTALPDVLFDAGWADRGFALATGYDSASGNYRGLSIPLEDHDFSPVDEQTLLVRPELATAQRQREREEARAAAPAPSPVVPAPGPGVVPVVTPPPPPKPPIRHNVRWNGRFEVDPESDVTAALAKIGREIVGLLLDAGPEALEVSVAITAERHDGFDEGTVRAVRENAQALGAAEARFEDA